MSTKAEERKALEEIEKIVKSLGNDSYVAMAFEGCFELAADNIENDWGCSMKQRAEDAENKLENMRRDAAGTDEALEAARIRIERLESRNVEAINHCQQELDKLAEENRNLRKQVEKQTESDAEILKLKAMLFDYMIKTA